MFSTLNPNLSRRTSQNAKMKASSMATNPFFQSTAKIRKIHGHVKYSCGPSCFSAWVSELLSVHPQTKQVDTASLSRPRLLRCLYLASIPLPYLILKQTFLDPCRRGRMELVQKPVLALRQLCACFETGHGVSPSLDQDLPRPPKTLPRPGLPPWLGLSTVGRGDQHELRSALRTSRSFLFRLGEIAVVAKPPIALIYQSACVTWLHWLHCARGPVPAERRLRRNLYLL